MNEQIPFNRFLGIRVGEVRDGFVALDLPFREEFVGNPMVPALHGGVLSALLDTCGGAAVWTQVDDGDSVSTVDLRVDYLRPGPLADLRCEGTVQRLGNRVGVVDMRLFATGNPERLIATGKGVYNVKRADD
ncbi:MAG: PaaI family thioesterase [Deltaproteobacteria bacterium]|nr:PaaI family thioesterase [Deltaproteobacteria bacterium]